MGSDAMIFVFWMLSFKPAFSLSSFIFIRRLFSSSSLSAIRAVSFAYLRLLIFLPAILISACDSSSLAFLIMYSAYVRRQWHATSVLLPGKSHGQRSLVGCSPWGCEESGTTEWLPFHFHALEKEMATHSSVLAWRIPGMGKPGVLPSMGSHRVGHNWSDLAAAAEPFNFSFFSISGCGIDLDYCDIEWFVLETNRSFHCFWNCIQVLHFGIFWLWGLFHFF